MLDQRGFVAETNATHLFMVSGGRVETSRTVACPEGITRETVLQICDAEGIPREVRDISLTEFYRADEVFCTGTMGELAPVVSIDGRTIGDGASGPMTTRLGDAYARLTASEGTPVV
jgi:branched-chain amino acid aminotransferase